MSRGESVHRGHEWKSPAWTTAQVGRKRPTEEGLQDLPREVSEDPHAERYYLVDVRVVRSEPHGGGLGLYELRPVWSREDREAFLWTRREARRTSDGDVALPSEEPPLVAVRDASEPMSETPPPYQGLTAHVLREQYRDTLREVHGLDLPEPIVDGGEEVSPPPRTRWGGWNDVAEAKEAARDNPDLSTLTALLGSVSEVSHVGVFNQEDPHLETYIELSFSDEIGRGTEDAVIIARRAGWSVLEVVWSHNWLRLSREGDS